MFSVFLFVIHVVFSLYFFGLIWFVQIVHYPSFYHLNLNENHNPFLSHIYRTSGVVLPAMILELTSIVLLVFYPYPNILSVLFLLILTLLIWVVTFSMQAPCHKKLKIEKDENLIRRLIMTNWLRTALWSAKAIYIFFLLWALLGETIVLVV